MDDFDLPTTDWRLVVRLQGRTLKWLASQTDRAPRTVYAYSQRKLTPSAEWLRAAGRALHAPIDNGADR